MKTPARRSRAAAAEVATSTRPGAPVQSLFVSAQDGLRLHVREYGARATAADLCVVCLPGLARTADDFDPLARALANDPECERRVLALDYRGRGASERDKDWRNYNVSMELSDTLAVLDARGVRQAVIIGTSRGGLISMGMAAARPGIMAGVVFNDIGPVIETQGLLRIRGYVGKLPQPRDWREAGEILRRASDTQFPDIILDDWVDLARLTWRERKGQLESTYDPNLMKTLEDLDLERPLPPSWHLFDALPPVPLLTLRGEHSDILSEDTLDAMRERRPHMDIFRVKSQGHAPFLRDRPTINRICAFVRTVEAESESSH